MRTRALPLLLMLCFVLPLSGHAQSETLKPFTESFTSLSRIEQSKTSAVVDTKTQAVFLPTQTRTLWSTNPTGSSRGSIVASAGSDNGILTGSSTGVISFVSYANGQSQIIATQPRLKTVRFIATLADTWILVGTSTANKLMFFSVDGNLQIRDISPVFDTLKPSSVRGLTCATTQCAIDTNKGIITFDTASARTAFEANQQPGGQVTLTRSDRDIFAIIPRKEKDIFTLRIYSLTSGSAIVIPTTVTFSSSPTVFAGEGTQRALVIARVKNAPAFYYLTVAGLQGADFTYDGDTTGALSRGSFRISEFGTQWIAYAPARNGALYLLTPTATQNLALATDITSSLRPATVTARGTTIILAGDSSGPLAKAVEIGSYVASSTIQSRAVIRSSKQPIEFVTLDAKSVTPSGTRIDYFVSNNDGRTWESVTPQTRDTFILAEGKTVRWMAVLSTNDTTVTPVLSSVTISTATQTGTSIADQNRRDSTRVSDIGRVVQLIERFKKQEGVYPVVESSRNYPADRWEQLQGLLQDAKITTSKLPTDPGKGTVSAAYEYDYISSATGDAYGIKTILENKDNRSLAQDIDSTILRTMDCTDPGMCRAGGIVQ